MENKKVIEPQKEERGLNSNQIKKDIKTIDSTKKK